MPRPPLVPLALAVLIAVAIALTALLTGSSDSGSSSSSQLSSASSSSRFDGAALPYPGIPAPDFTLADQSGRAVALSGLRGRVVVLTFLYSTCGAACVVIAQQIRGALDELPHQVPVLIVSADPVGDTPGHVREFLGRVSLAGRVRYLTGPPATLRSLWRAYRVTPASAGRAAFGRYAEVLLIDRGGRERVIFQQEQLTPEALAHDIRTLEGG